MDTFTSNFTYTSLYTYTSTYTHISVGSYNIIYLIPLSMVPNIIPYRVPSRNHYRLPYRVPYGIIARVTRLSFACLFLLDSLFCSREMGGPFFVGQGHGITKLYMYTTFNFEHILVGGSWVEDRGHSFVAHTCVRPSSQGWQWR